MYENSQKSEQLIQICFMKNKMFVLCKLFSTYIPKTKWTEKYISSILYSTVGFINVTVQLIYWTNCNSQMILHPRDTVQGSGKLHASSLKLKKIFDLLASGYHALQFINH